MIFNCCTDLTSRVNPGKESAMKSNKNIDSLALTGVNPSVPKATTEKSKGLKSKQSSTRPSKKKKRTSSVKDALPSLSSSSDTSSKLWRVVSVSTSARQMKTKSAMNKSRQHIKGVETVIEKLGAVLESIEESNKGSKGKKKHATTITEAMEYLNTLKMELAPQNKKHKLQVDENLNQSDREVVTWLNQGNSN